MKNLLEKAKVNMLKSWIPVREVITDNKGEGMIDIVVGIMISVVIGGLLLAGLYTLFGQQILPDLTRKIQEMFNYAG